MIDAFKRARLTHKGGCDGYDCWHNVNNRAYKIKRKRIARHAMKRERLFNEDDK